MKPFQKLQMVISPRSQTGTQQDLPQLAFRLIPLCIWETGGKTNKGNSQSCKAADNRSSSLLSRQILGTGVMQEGGYRTAKRGLLRTHPASEPNAQTRFLSNNLHLLPKRPQPCLTVKELKPPTREEVRTETFLFQRNETG